MKKKIKIKITREQKNRIKNVYLAPLNQIWHIIRLMPKEDREAFISYVSSLDTMNCPFVFYNAKGFLNKMIDHTECYFNGLGYTTPVKR